MKTLDQILTATTFEELFPEGTKKEYRALLKQTHPDLHPSDRDKAQKAFVHVTTIWTYKTATPKPTTTTPENTIITKRHTYVGLKQRRVTNNIVTYEAEYDSGIPATLLIANHPKVGEQLLNGTRNLKTILDEIPEDYKDFFVKTEDIFRIEQAGNQKTVGLMQPSMKEFYTLREVLEDYPEGVSGEDTAWMYRRMLVCIGNTHDAGYAHGAPTLDAFHIKPATHEVKLSDWQYSQELGGDLQMSNPDIKAHYSADNRVMNEKKDMKIATEAILKLVNPKTTPKRIHNYFKAMTRYPAPTAAEALGEYDALLKEMYGERTFHHFRMRRTV